MDRRDVLIAGAALLAAGTVNAAEAHNHGPTTLADAAEDCVKSGQACLAHCLQILGTGDTSMAECSKTVTDMLATAQALAVLSYAGSKFTAQQAKLVQAVTKECEAACRKHADKHAVCKICADSCAKLQSECAKA